MDISIVILTWNSENYIKNCLTTLIADLYDSKFTYEIFVVDNGSSDKSIEIISAYKNQFPQIIKPIFLDKNTGTTYSRNLALKKSTGKYICIMDSDVEVRSGTIKELVNQLKHNNMIGLIVPKLVYPNGMLQKSTDSFPTIYTKIIRFFFLKFIEKTDHEKEVFTGLMDVDYAISAMWVLRRDVLETVGLLDEKIYYAPEDVDYCLRIRKAGYHIVYNPYVISVHHTQEISRGFKLNKATFHHVKGLLYYFRKYNSWFKHPIPGSVALRQARPLFERTESPFATAVEQAEIQVESQTRKIKNPYPEGRVFQ